MAVRNPRGASAKAQSSPTTKTKGGPGARLSFSRRRVLLDRDLGDIPQDRGAQIHDIGVLAADLVNQAAGIVFAAAQAGLRPAHRLAAVEIHLVEPSRSAIGTEDILLAAGIGLGNAQAPGRAHAGDGLLEVQVVIIDLD